MITAIDFFCGMGGRGQRRALARAGSCRGARRHGVADPARQWVSMTVADLANLLNPPRLPTEEEKQA